MDSPDLLVVGGGLAGCEAAWQAAQRGLNVWLYEMKPQQFSPAHQSPGLAELVCSNSLRGAALTNAVGLLKEELRRCHTLFIAAADANAVPAGGALAVDREGFSATITEKIAQHPRIRLIRQEMVKIPAGQTVILATGPLTSDAFSATLADLTGAKHLYFYDAIAPIVEADSIDLNIAWRASRYGKGSDDYLNCPLSEEQYHAFVAALRSAEKVAARDFEKMIHFEGCMPIEEMAARGELTLAFGPMKPVGLADPRTGREPFAVVQLRQDDRHASLYNLVGFQTKLTYPEQRRILRTIPGLENARFARLGSVHRNTFINAPRCLNHRQQFISDPRLYFAGQITGVEGYVESAASGFLAGLFASAAIQGKELPLPPFTTACGALLSHLAESHPDNFQPMNINYGLFPPLEKRSRKRADRRLAMAERALKDLDVWREQIRQAF